MKKLILTLSAALFVTAAQASVCVTIGSFARTVMDARQAGVAMSKVMAIVDGDRIQQRIVMQAYEKPRYQTEEYKRRAVEDFGNHWEAACYKATTGGSNV